MGNLTELNRIPGIRRIYTVTPDTNTPAVQMMSIDDAKKIIVETGEIRTLQSVFQGISGHLAERV